MGNKIKIAPRVSLPIDAATEVAFVCGVRGSGKTYCGGVIVEEILGIGVPTVVFDPTDAHWGLRSSASGKRGGLPIIVLGGPHGDLPLAEGDAKAIADLVSKTGVSMILSMKHLSDDAQRRFFAAFCHRLYKINEHPVHLVVDEADIFGPQQVEKGSNAHHSKGAFNKIVRRGRLQGIGVTLVTQRSAVLEKNLVSQAETLVALRLTSSHDQAVVEHWIKNNADRKLLRKVLGSLPGLENGEAIVWSPRMLGPKPIHTTIRKKRTFDSSATPKVGKRRATPKVLAKVDLEAFKKQLQMTVEQAKADDPRELRKQIKHLERELVAAKKQPTAAPKAFTAKADREAAKELKRATKLLEKAVTKAQKFGTAIGRTAKEIGETLTEFCQKSQLLDDSCGELGAVLEGLEGATRSPNPAPSTVSAASQRAPVKIKLSPALAGDPPTNADVSQPQQRILDAIAWLGSVGMAQPSKTQVALVAGASPKSGSYHVNLGSLRSAGLLVYPSRGYVELTAEGTKSANTASGPQDVEEFHAQLRDMLSRPQWAIVAELVNRYPEAAEKSAVAKSIGVSPASGSYHVNLGRLRSLGLVTYPKRGAVAATPVTMLERTA